MKPRLLLKFVPSSALLALALAPALALPDDLRIKLEGFQEVPPAFRG